MFPTTVLGQNVTEHNPAPSPAPVSGPPTRETIVTFIHHYCTPHRPECRKAESSHVIQPQEKGVSRARPKDMPKRRRDANQDVECSPLADGALE